MATPIYVKSATDHVVIMHVPSLLISKTWNKRGQKYPFELDQLIQAYYDPSVEYLFKQGLLTTDSKEFLKAVGLMDEDDKTNIINLDEALLNRIVKHMSLVDLKPLLVKLSRTQLNELGEYAVAHYKELALDRVDILTKATGKDILKAIENYKKAQEE